MKEAVNESLALETLRKVKVLESLTEKQILLISRCLKTQKYKENEYIIKQGDDGDSFFMIGAGDVAVQVNHVEVAKLGVGKYFGELGNQLTLTYSLTYLLSYLLTHSLTHSLTYSLTYLLTHLIIYSLTHSLIY
jgi:signal-transduction protein with cAMP-binding, CBS, and nucleotidyltransferase domain